MIEIGKLFKCPTIDLLLFSSINDVNKFIRNLMGFPDNTTMFYRASMLSKKLGAKVSFVEKNHIFMIVDQQNINNQRYIKILYGEAMGWFLLNDWFALERLN